MTEALPPSRIRPDHERLVMHVVWQDGRECRLPMRHLRAACTCARCVDEVTGERLVFLEDISPDVRVSEMNLAGNYAVRIFWSDGHSTGLYTWARLDALCFGNDAIAEAQS